MIDEVKARSKELSKNRAVKIYKKVLKGTIKGFPYGFWARNDNKYEDASCCIKYLVEVVLKWEHEDMKKMTKSKLRLYKLGGMLDTVFDGDLYQAMDCAYKYIFYPWNLSRCQNGYWNEENAPIAIRNNMMLKRWSGDDIRKKYGYDFFRETGLIHMLNTVYDGDIYEALNSAYPGQYKMWELKRVKSGYWTQETIAEAVRWMIEDKLCWEKEDVKRNLNKRIFEVFGLGGMLYNECDNSPYKALQIAYPGEYEVWELSRVSKNYWDRETGLKVIKHLIEDEWRYSKEDIKVKLSRKDFVDNGYEYLLDEIFKGDIYGIINEIYPNEFRKNELKGVRYREKKDNLLMSQIKWYD